MSQPHGTQQQAPAGTADAAAAGPGAEQADGPGPETPGSGTPPTVWAILEERAGDDAQVANLVESLGWPYEPKKPLYSLWEVLVHRMTGIGAPARRPGRPLSHHPGPICW